MKEQNPVLTFGAQNGAEAVVDLVTWDGAPAIRKIRAPKMYRNPKLDQSLRSRRTKQEVVILHATKRARVHCPKVLFVDPDKCEIIMEYIQGTHLKDIAKDPLYHKISKALYLELGKAIASLHKSKIVHGDLTTKNIFLKERKIQLIDFGLSFFTERIEDQADDLHLLKQALKSTNSPSTSANAFSTVMQGYEMEVG